MTNSPDMRPPQVDHVEPYDVPRGTCPACGSGAVRHLIVGFPEDPEAESTTPSWVEWVGCMHPGYDRRCRACGTTWTEDDVDE